MAVRVPRHRIDAPAKFVSVYDQEAWNGRFEQELRKLADEVSEAGKEPDEEKREKLLAGLPEPSDHPVFAYRRGETRFDIDAKMKWRGHDVTVREYLDLDKATIYTLARLPPAKRTEAHAIARTKSEAANQRASMICLRWGILDIENGVTVERSADGSVSDATIQDIIDAGGYHSFDELAAAIYVYNGPLTDAEKKA